MSDEDHADRPPRRPILLGVALIVMSLVGLNTLNEGYATIELIRDPFSGARVLGEQTDAITIAATQARIQAIQAHPTTLLPIGIAQLLLGSLLVLVGFNALIGRRASAGFALQAITASAILAGLGFVLREPIRQAIFDALAAASPKSSPISPTSTWWIFRVKLAAELAALGLSAFALTRRSVREALAPPEPSADEEY